MKRQKNDGEAEDVASTVSMTMLSEDKSPSRHPLDSWKGKALTQEACMKVNQILAACGGEGQDLSSLVALATAPGGLVDDEVRRIACMSIMGRQIPISEWPFRASATGLRAWRVRRDRSRKTICMEASATPQR